MEKYIEQLDSKSKSALKSVLNGSVQSILSGDFDVDIRYNYILTSAISIIINTTKYLIITNDWADTPEYGLDYYFLKVRIKDKPKDIKTSKSKHLNSSLIHHPNMSSLCLGKMSKLKEITVYERIEKCDTEKIQCDSAILFKRFDGISFLVKDDNSIAGGLKIVYNKKDIKKELSELKLRLQI